MNSEYLIYIGWALALGGAFIYYIKSNVSIINEDTKELSYTSYYDITDDSEHYEHFQEKDSSIKETTPAGEVILLYNNDKNQFHYYSNNDIPYRYLEVVVRKYVLTYNCINLYVDVNKSFSNAKKEYYEKLKMKQEDNNVNNSKKVDDIFVQYKSYNKQDYKINHSNKPIKRDIIVLKRMGNLYEYNSNANIEKPKKTIGFSDYKNKVL